LAVLDPLKVTLINWEGGIKNILAPLHPKEKSRGSRDVPFSGVIYIEKNDFRLEDIKGYKRLAPNKEVGLLHAGYTITCVDVVKDSKGNVVELKATVNTAPTGKPKGYINWVAQPASGVEPFKIEARLYEKLFIPEDMGSVEDWIAAINPQSLVITSCLVEPALKACNVGDTYQFERLGFFCKDADSTTDNHVWNRVVGLKETKWEEKDK